MGEKWDQEDIQYDDHGHNGKYGETLTKREEQNFIDMIRDWLKNKRVGFGEGKLLKLHRTNPIEITKELFDEKSFQQIDS